MIENLPEYSGDTLFEENSMPLFMIELGTHRIIKANKSAENKFKYSRNELLSMDLSDLRHEEDRTVVPIPRWNVTNGHYLETTCRCLTKDHNSINLSFTARLIQYENKEVAYMVVNDMVASKSFAQIIANARNEAVSSIRESLAQEIHDGLAQTLAASHIYFRSLHKELDFSTEQMQRFERALVLLQQGIEEARTLAHDTIPDSLNDPSFSDLIEELMVDFSSIGDHVVKYTCDLNGIGINQKIKVNTYRMLQEILGNIRKHAKASLIKVEITILKQKKLKIVVEDDGVGFDLLKVKDSPGIGLTSLKKRTANLNGILNIYSEVGSGTKIIIRVPLEN